MSKGEVKLDVSDCVATVGWISFRDGKPYGQITRMRDKPYRLSYEEGVKAVWEGMAHHAKISGFRNAYVFLGAPDASLWDFMPLAKEAFKEKA